MDLIGSLYCYFYKKGAVASDNFISLMRQPLFVTLLFGSIEVL
jgi:hypothetical protein